MPDTTRVSPQYVHDRIVAGEDTLLVCAYEDEEKHRLFDLDGSIGLHQLRAELPDLPKEREVVFYCS